MSQIVAQRQDIDTVQASPDGNIGPLVMNQYGYLKIEQNTEIKENLDEMKADLATAQADIALLKSDLAAVKAILDDVYNSSAHSLKVSVL